MKSKLANPEDVFSKKPDLVRTNLSAQIYEFLEDQIVSGQIRPGTKLAEVAIADSLGVSRQPVREAIARLERLGLASRGRRDRVVARPTERLICETYEVWWVLDAGRTYLSSLSAAEEDLAEMRDLLEQMETATQANDRASLARCSQEFHKLISGRCRNAQLESAMQGCALYIRWFRGLYLKSRKPSEARLKEHKRIVDCYARKDLSGLIEVVHQHVLRQRAEVLEAWRKETSAADQEQAENTVDVDRLRLAES